ncbi:MAG: hypothetical protein JWN03_7197 [Nocardia sp.]|uniref:hypothetical protein n=1 Tax=Nocardia sp. TaxID=1821 RepID=UPI00260D4512|nr:hypothetical protein [Nocardia sp.]MCU1646922.1 hypothetical protein [Nocardia sp.]
MKPMPGLLRGHRQHILTPLDDGRTRYESHFVIAGPLSIVVGGIFGGAMRKGFGDMTDGLEKRAESLRAVRD